MSDYFSPFDLAKLLHIPGYEVYLDVGSPNNRKKVKAICYEDSSTYIAQIVVDDPRDNYGIVKNQQLHHYQDKNDFIIDLGKDLYLVITPDDDYKITIYDLLKTVPNLNNEKI